MYVKPELGIVVSTFPITFSGPQIVGYRNRWSAVQIRPSASAEVAQSDRAAVNIHLRSLPAFILDGPKTSGYRSLVRLQSEAPNSSVAKWYSNSRVVPCPSFFRRVEWRDNSTATFNHGDRMANNTHDWEESNFEIISGTVLGGRGERSSVGALTKALPRLFKSGFAKA